MKKKFTLFTFILFFIGLQIGLSQTILRSIASSTWATIASWEKSTDAGLTWAAATSAPTSNQNVIIQSPNAITLDATKSCLNLTINSGATLSAGAANAIRVGTSSSGTAGTIGVLTNNGTFGVTGDLIPLELPTTAKQLTITSTSTMEAGRIRAIASNVNNPSSAVTGHGNDATIIIDANINLNTPTNYCVSLPNSTVSATDVMILTINSGKIVKVIPTDSKWENTLMTSGGAITGGNYTYNINGTLDLANTTTGTSAFVPYSNAASSITVNVNGLVKLGKLFKADTVLGSLGGLYLNIGNGGLLDASLTTSFNCGKTGTTATNGGVNANGNIFFVVSGTGAIQRTAVNDGSTTKFPYGTSLSSYTPMTITRAAAVAAPAVFTSNVQNTFSNPYPFPAFAVTKQWNIALNSGVADASDVLTLSWTTPDQAASFNPALPVYITHWNGSSWDKTLATVTGTGTIADPYFASASGFTSFSPFGVANAAALPLSIISFNASLNANKNALLNWTTTNEVNTKDFSIERSIDGVQFTKIGTVNSLNRITTNNYTFTDLQMPTNNIVYYRLKQNDVDGKFGYSKIVLLNNKNKKGVSVFPNPTNSNVNISYGVVGKGSTISVYNTEGKLMYKQNIIEGTIQTTFDVSSFSRGSYEVIINDGQNKQSIHFLKN